MRHTNYDEIAANYDQRYAEENFTGIELALRDFVGPSAERVLEVGCGTGHWLRLLHSRGVNAVGVDLSWQMLVRAREKLSSALLVQANAEDIPLKSGGVDCLFCINAHHHFANIPRFVTEARRVLRPGGLLMTVALDPHIGTDQWWVYDYFDGTKEMDKERYPSCEQLRHWLNAAGITDVVTREVQHLPGDVGASEALVTGMITPSYTSQLAILTRDEFSAGVERIKAAIVNDSSLRLTADLRVYATLGRVPR
jgi:SAM-dependent methyltransferase